MKLTTTFAILLLLAGKAFAVPVTIADLGSISNGNNVAGTLSSDVHWYSFTLETFSYLDINTNGSDADTEIGLFDAAGFLLANDDDDGIGLDSTLTFGTGSGLLLGDSFNLNSGIADGEDGGLAAGTYYLAIGAFNTTFADNFDVVGGGSGAYTIDFYTDNADMVAAPEPGILVLVGLGLAGLGFARRRS